MLSDDQFDMGMGKLMAANKDYDCTPATIEVYRERIQSRLKPEEWEMAVNLCLDTLKWFPKISELLAAADSNRRTPEEIWAWLKKEAESGVKPELDGPTETALLAVGGWEDFSVTDYDDLKYFFKTFKEVYQVAAKQEQNLKALPAGEGQALLEG